MTSDARPTRRSRITKTTRDMLLRSRSVPRVFALDDDVSEAGTYTIDAPQETRDVTKARKSIDQIFNVPGKRNRNVRADVTPTSSAFKPVIGASCDLSSKPGDVNGNFANDGSGAGARNEPDQEDVFSPRINKPEDHATDDIVSSYIA